MVRQSSRRRYADGPPLPSLTIPIRLEPGAAPVAYLAVATNDLAHALHVAGRARSFDEAAKRVMTWAVGAESRLSASVARELAGPSQRRVRVSDDRILQEYCGARGLARRIRLILVHGGRQGKATARRGLERDPYVSWSSLFTPYWRRRLLVRWLRHLPERRGQLRAGDVPRQHDLQCDLAGAGLGLSGATVHSCVRRPRGV